MSPIYILNNRRTNNKTGDEWNNKKSFFYFLSKNRNRARTTSWETLSFFSCTSKISREGSEKIFDFCWSSQRVVLLISLRFAATFIRVFQRQFLFSFSHIALKFLLFLHTFLVSQFLILVPFLIETRIEAAEWVSWKINIKNLPIIVWLLKCLKYKKQQSSPRWFESRSSTISGRTMKLKDIFFLHFRCEQWNRHIDGC